MDTLFFTSDAIYIQTTWRQLHALVLLAKCGQREQPVSSASSAAGLDDERTKLLAELNGEEPPAKKAKTEE